MPGLIFFINRGAVLLRSFDRPGTTQVGDAFGHSVRTKIDAFMQWIDHVLFWFGSILVACCSSICSGGGSCNKVSSLQHLRALAVTEPFDSRPQHFKTDSSRTLQLIDNGPWLMWQTHLSFQDSIGAHKGNSKETTSSLPKLYFHYS